MYNYAMPTVDFNQMGMFIIGLMRFVDVWNTINWQIHNIIMSEEYDFYSFVITPILQLIHEIF